MKVGFLHVGIDTRLPKIMVRSCLHFGYEPIQMTDELTPAIDGCQVVRLPWDRTKPMTYRLEHLARLGVSELTVLDTDVVVVRDLSPVWEESFDVALTRRGQTLDPAGVDLSISMPFNTGVMFARNPKFWEAARDVCASLPIDRQNWWGDQLSVKKASEAFDLLELDATTWNYTPASIDEEDTGAKALHYKGQRKIWMLERFGNGTNV